MTKQKTFIKITRKVNLFSPIIIVAIVLFASTESCTTKNTKMNLALQNFISQYDSAIIPLSKQKSLAYWDAAISGKEEDYKMAENYTKQFAKYHSNKEHFKQLETIKASGAVTDTILKRQLDVLYLTYLSYQADSELLDQIIEMETEIEQKYSNFRATIKNKQLTDNDIEQILSQSVNSSELQAAWEAHKKIGPQVSSDIIALVEKRNALAKGLGFANYHEMSLRLSDQDPFEIERMFDELDELTKKSFSSLKNEIDSILAIRYKIAANELMPWHYQNRFFQEAPKIYQVDLDKYYKNKNLEQLTSNYFSSIGLPIDDMLKKSDLYEKPGKNQHAFCISIDKAGDVRVLCNIKPNAYWMNTMLHEFGHAVYDKFIDPSLPFTLRDPAHIFTTEAIAMLFGRMSSNPQWIQDFCKISDAEKEKISVDCYKTLRLEQLTFSRWAQVMYRFEKSMYANPNQDLNKLWWDLVSQYQLLKKPANRNEPDWAAKIHIATSPCYYHNYLLGELLASQLQYYISVNIIKDSVNIFSHSYTNSKKTGEFLRKMVFEPGSKLYWNQMIENATGEKLTARYYARQFVE